MTTGEIPITVVGGYLGAGKTTIIQRLLEGAFEDENQPRIAVLINDFGQINIDASRIARRTDDVIEMSNGCVCCSLIDGFVETLDAIAGWANPPDHLVIEPSGVADPMSVAQYAFLPGFQLAGVAVAADCDALARQLADKRIGPSIRRQIERADLILATKTDLGSMAETDEAKSMLTTLTDGPIIDVVDGYVDPSVLLGLTTTRDSSQANPSLLTDQQPTGSMTLESTAVVLSPVAAIDRPDLETWLASAPPAVVRAKGSVSDGERGGFDIDLVGSRTTISHRAELADEDLAFVVLYDAGMSSESNANAIREWLAGRSLRSAEASPPSIES